MDEPAYDIAMKFVLKGGGPVLAESTLQVTPGDVFMRDFHGSSDYKHYSNFFEVQSFDFSLAVEPEDAGKGNLSRGGAGPTPGGHPGGHPGSLAAGAHAGGGSGTGPANGGGSSDPFHRWRSATEEEARRLKFQLTFDSFRFSRIIDGASPIFFQMCCQQRRFESAALIKRVATGYRGMTGGDRQSMAFMRMEFKDVMLKSVKWSDGELVTESVEFVCQWMSYQYRQQRADGTLEPPQQMAVWDRSKDSRRTEERR